MRKYKMKYKNQKIMIDGIKFDSKREAEYFLYLKQLQKDGLISDLELQPKFELQPHFKFNGKMVRAINYIADFRYYDVKKGEYVVVDVKGMKTDVYKLKKKLFEYKYNTEIVEV